MRSIQLATRVVIMIATALALAATAVAQTTPTAFFDLGGASKDSSLGVVRDAGDVNGDGYLDVVVGAPDEGPAHQGAARVFSGRTGEAIRTFSHYVPLFSDYFGTAVCGAGDVDLDGRDDVLVGAPMKETGGPGYVVMFSGKTDLTLYKVYGEFPRYEFGGAAAAIGDINADGVPDVAVGAPQGLNAGSGYVRLMSGKNGSTLFTLQDLVYGDHGDLFGFSVAPAGDVNGDSIADFIVGEPGYLGETGSVFVFSGRDASVIWRWVGQMPLDRFGNSVSGPGDLDGDGFADLLVGAPGVDVGFQNAGSASILSGKAGTVLSTIHGAAVDAALGSAVSVVGDVNQDGITDFMVAAPGSCASTSQAGYVQVGFLSGSTYQVLYQAQGDSVGDSFGASVSTAGDINHDGFTDFLVGSPCNDRDGKDAGSARVFSGHLYPASWNNYGAGFPGTNCEPSLTAGGAPVICETITLDITNCSGQNTPSLLIAGLAPGVISNPSGGTILVSPPWVLHPFMLPIAGASLPVEVLCDSAFCGLTIYAQALEFDPGAGGPNQDVSSSKGLALVLGGS